MRCTHETVWSTSLPLVIAVFPKFVSAETRTTCALNSFAVAFNELPDGRRNVLICDQCRELAWHAKMTSTPFTPSAVCSTFCLSRTRQGNNSMNDMLTPRGGLIVMTLTTQERPPKRHTWDPRERHAKVLESVIPEQPNISYRMQDIIEPVGNMTNPKP